MVAVNHLQDDDELVITGSIRVTLDQQVIVERVLNMTETNLTLRNIAVPGTLCLYNSELQRLTIENSDCATLDLSGLPELRVLEYTGSISRISSHPTLRAMTVTSNTEFTTGNYPNIDSLYLSDPTGVTVY